MENFEFKNNTYLRNLNETNHNITNIFGPERDSLNIVIPVTVIYTMIFITGVIGNISTCIVIKKNRSMHTATNYYLFSLAISDFLLLLSGVPQEMYFIWSKYPYVFGETICVGRGLLAETSANATVLTITAFTVERYVAICHPFLTQAMSKKTRIIWSIWLMSLLTALPQAAQFGIINEFGVSKCAVVRIIIDHSFELSTFIFFFAPMSIILILYLLIGLKLHRTNLMRSTNGSRTQQGTKRVLKMLVAVVIAFFLCWAPFHAQRLIAVYGTGEDIYHNSKIIALYNVMTYVSGVLYYLSTCINPLLYNIMSNKFREAFKETFQRFNIFKPKANEPAQTYILSRAKRLRVAFQEFDYSSSSQREESYQSNTSWRNFDSIVFVSNNTYNDSTKKSCNLINRDNLNEIKNIDRIKVSDSSQSFNNTNEQKLDILNSESIVKIDEFTLPSKDASLNVLYTKEGSIQIRIQHRR